MYLDASDDSSIKQLNMCSEIGLEEVNDYVLWCVLYIVALEVIEYEKHFPVLSFNSNVKQT